MSEENATLQEIKPAIIVEGVLCNKIVSIQGAIECLNAAHIVDLDPITNVKTTYHIVRTEVQEMVELLKPYTQASLAPKHRLARRIMKHYLEHLKKHDVMNSELQSENDPVCLEFTRELIRFIDALSNSMIERKTAKERLAVTRVYCGTQSKRAQA